MNKLCYVISLILLAPLVLADGDDEIMSCVELFNPENANKMCCEDMSELHSDNADCEKGSNEDMIENCDYPRCLLNSEGLLDGDKLIDSKVREMLDKQVKENPDEKGMADRIKKHCLDGKYESFPPKNACLPVKFLMCSYINAIVECPKFRKEDGCDKMAEHAKKCKKIIDKDISFDF